MQPDKLDPQSLSPEQLETIRQAAKVARTTFTALILVAGGAVIALIVGFFWLLAQIIGAVL